MRELLWSVPDGFDDTACALQNVVVWKTESLLWHKAHDDCRSLCTSFQRRMLPASRRLTIQVPIRTAQPLP